MVVSRTIYVPETKEIFTENEKFLKGLKVTISEGDSGTYFEFENDKASSKVFEYLKAENYRPRYVEYELFFKLEDPVTDKSDVEELVNVSFDCNILYIGLYNNKKCGKLVVDKYEDYNLFKTQTTNKDKIKFYRFKKPKRKQNKKTDSDSD